VTYATHVNVALAVAMPDGGLITPTLKAGAALCSTFGMRGLSTLWDHRRWQ
jgi:hypothetical protein